VVFIREGTMLRNTESEGHRHGWRF